MKIAVYAIALNEEKFAQRWADSAAEADYRVVADTGSTDGTVALLRHAGVTVHDIAIKPWRFDHARNASLDLVPQDADICIPLDLDEVLLPGWRQALEAAWVPGTTRLRYSFVLSWDDKGAPRSFFYARKIHHRHGYIWRHAAHELIYPLPGVHEEIAWAETLTIHHLPDKAKPRGQYLDLITLAMQEDPADARCAHNYAVELMQHRRYAEAILAFDRYLAMPDATSREERAAAMRYLGRCYTKLGQLDAAGNAYRMACAEAPDAREPWYDLGKFCQDRKDWAGGVAAAEAMLNITEWPREHVRILKAWGVGPYDFGSICAYHTGQMDLAREWAEKALELAPDDVRLLKNRALIFAKR
nr:tetratricopeptide repeat protein [uncultured Dongia sp.]